MQKNALVIGSILLVVALSLLLLVVQKSFSIDHFVIVGLFGAWMLGRSRQFIWDWLPFVSLFIVYRYLRGLAPLINTTVHIHPMIDLDIALFGQLPPVSLQAWLHTPGVLQWYDYLGTYVYISHYVVTFLVAFVFWTRNRTLYFKFAFNVLLLSYLAFLTYVIFPAMPPWMASQQGFIPPITKIMVDVFANLPLGLNLFDVYEIIGANLVAAVPSLHAAYPVLVWLYLRKNPIIGSVTFIYLCFVHFFIIYLGEHYVIDAVLGIFYAWFSYLLVIKHQSIKSHISAAFEHASRDISERN